MLLQYAFPWYNTEKKKVWSGLRILINVICRLTCVFYSASELLGFCAVLRNGVEQCFWTRWESGDFDCISGFANNLLCKFGQSASPLCASVSLCAYLQSSYLRKELTSSAFPQDLDFFSEPQALKISILTLSISLSNAGSFLFLMEVSPRTVAMSPLLPGLHWLLFLSHLSRECGIRTSYNQCSFASIHSQPIKRKKKIKK